MTDYRFSSERPGKKLRLGLGTIVPYTAASLVPLPSVLSTWTEPSYTAQTQEYARTRIPIFVQNLDRVEAESQRIDAELRNRSAAGSIVGAGEQAVVVMPVTGACPPNGPLAYVYDDLFNAAQANLRVLGNEKPPRYSPVDVIARWSNLIDWNVSILRRASNIDGRYMMPETFDRAAEVYRPASWGSRRGGTTQTLHTQQGGFGPGETPVYRDGYPYPHNGEQEAIPQSLRDSNDAMDRTLRSALRLVRPVTIPSESCLYNPTSTCVPFYRADVPMNGVLLGALPDVGIARSRLFPLRRSMPGMPLLNQLFFTTLDQINSGWIRYGSPVDPWRVNGGAWEHLSTIWKRFPREGETDPVTGFVAARDAQGNVMTGWMYWNPNYALTSMQNTAREWARVSLPTLISEAIAWYIFNHNVWYAEKLGFTVEQLRAQQRALTSAGLDRTSGPIVSITGAVGSAVNPAIGVVIGIINAIGKELLLSFINIAPDIPKPLFLRIPDPAACEGRPEDQAGASLCPAGTTGVYPRCVPIPSGGGSSSEGGISLPIVAGASIAALLLLWAAKKKQGGLGEYDEDDLPSVSEEEAIQDAERVLMYSKWYKEPRNSQDARKGRVRFERSSSGDSSIVIDELFNCSDLNATIDDLHLAGDELEEVYAESDDPSQIEKYMDKISRRTSLVRRLARANGCTTINGLKRTK